LKEIYVLLLQMNPISTHSALDRATRILDRIDILADFSQDKEGLTRTLCSDAAREANQTILSWVEEVGLEGRIDSIGNIRVWSGNIDPDKKTFVIGSHLDTVINAGKFDGPLGFLIGLDLLEQFKDRGPDLAFNLEVVGFSDEEGVRYKASYLGSRVLAGNFSPELMHITDQEGIPLRQALKNFGVDPDTIEQDGIPEERFGGYFEIHMEQGPVLESRGVPIGLVTSIAGQIRAEITFTGKSGHAGTVPSDMRQDALCGGADFITEVENLANIKGDDLVGTVGKCDVYPNARNVIPGKVSLSLDLRSPKEDLLSSGYAHLEQEAQNIAEWKKIQENPSISCDRDLNNMLADSIESNGFPLVPLASWAGHDGVVIAEVAPIAMLFIRCRDGISHHPDEHVDLDDISAALSVGDTFIKNLTKAD